MALNSKSNRLSIWQRAGQYIKSEQVHLARLTMLGLLFVVVLRTAWMCDDGFIILRSVDNFVNGFGPVFNIGERVQSFTGPFWMFFLSIFYAITREPFYTTIYVSIGVTMVSGILICFKLARTDYAALLGILALILSRAFIDFSTSGLENPLSNLVMIIFMIVLVNEKPGFKKYFWLCFVAALGGFCRLDLLLVYLPALLYGWIETKAYQRKNLGKGLLITLAGFSPLILWLLFSLVYYGTFLPNTAYAKLSTGILQADLTRQGWNYYLSSLDLDPLTLCVICSGVLIAFFSRDWKKIALCAGALLYLGYIVYVGGDFMNGRFFTVPLCMIVGVLVTTDAFKDFQSTSIPIIIILLIGFSCPNPTLLSGSNYGQNMPVLIDGRGVADERAYYFQGNGLLTDCRGCILPAYPWAADGKNARSPEHAVMVVDAVGMLGYYIGPEKHLVDHYALVDPLLARLPVAAPNDWRIGHFVRNVPDGYVETLQTGRNQIAEPRIAKFYDYLNLIVHGPIFDPARWDAIWRLNTGQLDYLLDVNVQ